MERLKEFFQSHPWLVAGVVGIGGLLLLGLGRRRVSAPSEAVPVPTTPPPASGGSSGSSSISALAELITEQNEALVQALSQQQAGVDSMMADRDRATQEALQAISDRLATTTAKQEKVELWSPTSGWTATVVTSDNPYEDAVAAAKQLYKEAADRGDQAGMDAAHQAAEEARRAAEEAGVPLDSWTKA